MRAIFFDMDGTLYDREAAFARTFEEFFPGQPHALVHRAAVCCDKRSVFSLAEAAEGRMSVEEMHIYRFARGCEDAGIVLSDKDALEFQKCYAAHQRELCVSDRVRALIAFCRERFDRVGLITNGIAAHQAAKISRMGIDAMFEPDLILISGAVGTKKPEREIFDLAAARAGAKPEELLMVGDSYPTDIVGALNAGWQAIYFNREREPVPEGGPVPEYQVHSEEEMDDRIRVIAGA